MRSSIAYNYNNSVEKKLFDRAEQDRWNFLAYIDSTHPFSKEIDKKSASKKLLRSMDIAFLYHARNEYLDYTVVRRLFQGLETGEQEQLLDFIISLYLPIDKEALLRFYRSYDDMVLAINSNTGSEYDIREDRDQYSDAVYADCTHILKREAGMANPFVLIGLPAEQKSALFHLLKYRTTATPRQICKYLHISQRADSE